jgi:hypothetical protein
VLSPDRYSGTSCTLTAIDGSDDSVYAEYDEDACGATHLQAKFLVGGDGKTGFTRKKYLEPKGISKD